MSEFMDKEEKKNERVAKEFGFVWSDCGIHGDFVLFRFHGQPGLVASNRADRPDPDGGGSGHCQEI